MKTLRTKFFRAKAEKCPPPPTGKAVQSNKSNSLRVGMVDKSSTKRKLTRREQRDLDIEITFMEGLLQRDPKCIEALSVLSDDYSRRGKVTEGLKADVQLARIRPNDPAAPRHH
jgi:hypothetical protein